MRVYSSDTICKPLQIDGGLGLMAALIIGIIIGLVIIGFMVRAIQKNKQKASPDDKNNSIEGLRIIVDQLQNQLIEKEKIASIGLITAGIAHEIKNPLNFINNFSEMSVEILNDLSTELKTLLKNHPNEKLEEDLKIIDDMVTDLKQNCNKIHEHGKRAENIVKNMLLQARTKEVGKELTDLNQLIEEYLNLAYHGLRAQEQNFNITITKDLAADMGQILVSPQSIGQVFLNIFNNGFYATHEKKIEIDGSYSPTIFVKTQKDVSKNIAIITIRDNGIGIKQETLDNIFKPFFTTKPVGIGTGLGLSICYDIVVHQHKGEIKVDSKLGEYTEFIINLPLS